MCTHIPILRREKLRPIQVRQLARGHTWRGPSAFLELVCKAVPKQPVPGRLCSRPGEMLTQWTGHSAHQKGKICGRSSLWPNLAHRSSVLSLGPKPPQCSFICLTLALLWIPPAGRGNCSWDRVCCLFNPVPGTLIPHHFC